MKYINSGRTTRTFYDVEFKPGEIKDVPGYINDNKFFTVPEDTEQAAEITETTEQTAEIKSEQAEEKTSKRKSTSKEGEK